MKDYVREENCKFYVNEEKRKVVCTYDIDGTWYMYDMITDDKFPLWKEGFRHSCKMPSHFVGVATCAPEDDWNEELGRRVAFLKMRKKFYRSYFKAANRALDFIDSKVADMACEFNAFGEKIEESINREEKRLREVLSK